MPLNRTRLHGRSRVSAGRRNLRATRQAKIPEFSRARLRGTTQQEMTCRPGRRHRNGPRRISLRLASSLVTGVGASSRNRTARTMTLSLTRARRMAPSRFQLPPRVIAQRRSRSCRDDPPARSTFFRSPWATIARAAAVRRPRPVRRRPRFRRAAGRPPAPIGPDRQRVRLPSAGLGGVRDRSARQGKALGAPDDAAAATARSASARRPRRRRG